MDTIQDRILGIDYGEKRIGLALSDPFGWTAQPLKIVTYANRGTAFGEIAEVVKSYEVGKIVFGLPLHMSGEEGDSAKKVREFAQKLDVFLKDKCPDLPVEIEFIDERLSSAGAERVLIEADLSRKRRREILDKQAASLILQTYLDSKARMP